MSGRNDRYPGRYPGRDPGQALADPAGPPDNRPPAREAPPAELAEAVVAAIPGPLILADGGGTIVWTNEHASALFGYEAGELLGRSIDALAAHPARHGHVRRRYMEAPARRVFGKGRFLQAKRRDGSRFPVEIALQPITVGGAPHVLTLIRDVTERARLAEQLRRAQKMEALLTLGGALAHDFQNILTAIEGGVDLLREHLGGEANAGAMVEASVGGMPADARLAALREVATIDRAAERGQAVARALLDLVREPTASLERADLSALTAETLPLVARLLGGRVRVRALLGPALPAAMVPPNALTQALLNLAANARDALDGEGSVTIETRAVSLDHEDIPADFDAPPGPFVELRFSDDGAGMSRAVLARAAERFFTTKPAGQGTGLGLAQVYATALHAGGVLRIDSAPGQGTTVRLALRLA